MLNQTHAAGAPLAVGDEPAVYQKVTRKLLPFLTLCYVVAYLDRVNVGFAKLQMASDLHFSNTLYCPTIPCTVWARAFSSMRCSKCRAT